MRFNPFFAFMFFVMPAAANPLPDMQRSHIEGNLPPQTVFDAYLTRDITTYFSQAMQSNQVSVEYKMLRDGPTQSGVAYPKYYLTVKVLDKGIQRQIGAVRVAAIDQVRFEITHFVACSAANKSTDALAMVFPAALIDRITAFCGEN